MFERFTDRARRVVVLAQEEARMLDHNYIGTEHILLGLIHEEHGVGCKALEAMGISLDSVRASVEEIIGQGATPPTGHIPFTARAKRVMEFSLREALQLGHNYIGTEHLLLGLIREGEGVACQVLVKLGADLNVVRQTVIELLSGNPDIRTVGATGAFALSGSQIRAVTMPTEAPNPAAMPLCPGCRNGLEGKLRYRVLEALEAAEGGDEVRHVVFLFCTTCGIAIDDWMLPKDKP